MPNYVFMAFVLSTGQCHAGTDLVTSKLQLREILILKAVVFSLCVFMASCPNTFALVYLQIMKFT